MKSVRPDFLKLYAVTDEGPNLVERVRLAIEGGATCIQHRAKCASFEAAKANALAVQAVCRAAGVPFIVNDSLELALAVGADGLHVGQDDVPAREARRALGPDAILGVSAANVADAVRAVQDGADYIGTGAVFPSTTKPDAACVTPAELRAICGAVDIPVVAIGGIHAGNLLQLEHSGIAGVAVVSAIFGAPDVAAAAREIRMLVEQADFAIPDGLISGEEVFDESNDDGELKPLLGDDYYMRAALRCAQQAFDAGEVPVGAVAVKDGLIIARSWNQVELLKDPTAHAELMLIASLPQIIGDWRLDGIDIYVTKEPCAMCAGAMVNSRIRRVIFGMRDPRCGAAGTALNVTGFPGMLHNVEVIPGLMEEECKEMFQAFFRTVRANARKKKSGFTPPA